MQGDTKKLHQLSLHPECLCMVQIPLHHLCNGSVTYTRPGAPSKGPPKLPFLKKQELTPCLAWEGGGRPQVLGDEPSRGRASNLGMRQGMMGVGGVGRMLPWEPKSYPSGFGQTDLGKGETWLIPDTELVNHSQQASKNPGRHLTKTTLNWMQEAPRYPSRVLGVHMLKATLKNQEALGHPGGTWGCSWPKPH